MNNEMSFERNLKRLEEIVSLLEKNEVTLDESLALFQEGIELSRLCNEKLVDTEKQVVQIMENNQLKDVSDDESL